MSARLLGLVLAGGQSSRFGSDKAIAEIGGHTLLEHAVSRLTDWCKEVVVVGREDAPARVLADWPRAGMGPLGGIAAGLRHAQAHRFSSVLSCGVDSVDLPDLLPERLGVAPSYVRSQPVIGHWPADAAGALAQILEGDGRHSMLAFAEAIGARAVQLDENPANINTPEDLAEAEKRHDL